MSRICKSSQYKLNNPPSVRPPTTLIKVGDQKNLLSFAVDTPNVWCRRSAENVENAMTGVRTRHPGGKKSVAPRRRRDGGAALMHANVIDVQCDTTAATSQKVVGIIIITLPRRTNAPKRGNAERRRVIRARRARDRSGLPFPNLKSESADPTPVSSSVRPEVGSRRLSVQGAERHNKSSISSLGKFVWVVLSLTTNSACGHSLSRFFGQYAYAGLKFIYNSLNEFQKEPILRRPKELC